MPQSQNKHISFEPNCYIGTILGVWWLWWREPLGSHVSRWALSHSLPDITSSNHPSCSSQASFFSALLAKHWSFSRVGPLTGIGQHCFKEFTTQLPWASPDTLEGRQCQIAEMPSWAFGIPFVISSSCFVCASLHSSPPSPFMCSSSAVLSSEGWARWNQARWQQIFLVNASVLNILFLANFWRLNSIKLIMKELSNTLCTFLSVQGAPPHSLWWNLLNWWRHCPMSAEELLCDCWLLPSKGGGDSTATCAAPPFVGLFFCLSCNLILLFSGLLFPVRACCQRLPCSKL